MGGPPDGGRGEVFAGPARRRLQTHTHPYYCFVAVGRFQTIVRYNRRTAGDRGLRASRLSASKGNITSRFGSCIQSKRLGNFYHHGTGDSTHRLEQFPGSWPRTSPPSDRRAKANHSPGFVRGLQTLPEMQPVPRKRGPACPAPRQRLRMAIDVSHRRFCHRHSRTAFRAIAQVSHRPMSFAARTPTPSKVVSIALVEISMGARGLIRKGRIMKVEFAGRDFATFALCPLSSRGLWRKGRDRRGVELHTMSASSSHESVGTLIATGWWVMKNWIAPSSRSLFPFSVWQQRPLAREGL